MTEPPLLQRKILTRSELIERFGPPRDIRLVFTNGCFDVLHPGHVAYLDAARRLGDALVVGLNSDDSVRRLKGSGRPILGQEDRALMLAALESVDAVTFFGEDTPLDLITQLMPTVLVKGGDYDLSGIVGRDEVLHAGGEVTVIPFFEGHSTTDLVRRIREAE